jgi:hypothetical protein
MLVVALESCRTVLRVILPPRACSADWSDFVLLWCVVSNFGYAVATVFCTRI